MRPTSPTDRATGKHARQGRRTLGRKRSPQTESGHGGGRQKGGHRETRDKRPGGNRAGRRMNDGGKAGGKSPGGNRAGRRVNDGGKAGGNRPTESGRAAGRRATGGKRPDGNRAGRRVNDGGKRRKGAAPVKKARRAPASCLPANAPREGGQGNGAREKRTRGGPCTHRRGWAGSARREAPRPMPAHKQDNAFPTRGAKPAPPYACAKKGPLAGPLSQAADTSADAAPQGHAGHAQRK